MILSQKSKHISLFCFGGLIYILIELLWRGHSHWTMFLLGGLCFVSIGLINEIFPWTMPLGKQIFIAACMITALEFITGCIVNLWLKWAVWDYSAMSGNVLGQICPQYFALWIPVSACAIVLDDWLRFWWYGEEQPHYKLL